MSKIVITVSGRDWPASALVEFKRLTGVAPATVKAAGKDRPLIERALFLNDHPAVAGLLRAVIALDRAESLGSGYFELEPDEDFATAPPDHCRIDADVLSRILAEADDQFA